MSTGDITVIAVLAVMIAGALCVVIRDKLRHKCSCGCSCDKCDCGCACGKPLVPKDK